VIYPYNSASIFAPLHRGSLLVVHDFILHRRKVPGYWKMSAVLVRVTQWFYCLFNGDVAFITPHVERQALFLGRFERARRFLLPNCFRSFEHDASRRGSAIHGDYVLLCSGAVPSKDLRGALTHYRESAALSRHPLVILGLGKARADAREIAIELGIDPGRLTALGLVSQDELIDLYKKAALVWVHSLHEGFGRNLAEAVTCGKSVLASRIPPFKAQARDNRNIFLYENHVAASLEVAADQCAAHVFTPEPVDVSYDVLLRNLEKILN
jgi:glycosyltransferase involved in cell wall biosynthesis